MKQFLKQPVLYMFLLGILLFVVYRNISDFYEQRNRQIIVSADQIELLKETFVRTWNRPPTDQELDGLINNQIKEEVYFRQAVAMGLDKSDPAVKRRLRQMMELMLDDNAQVYPSEDQLREYLNANPEKFRANASISFQHVYFKADEEQEARDALQPLKEGSVATREVGRPIMIPSEFTDESSNRIQNTFGADFAAAVFDLEAGDWQGPVESAYGWHLVKISSIKKAEIPDLNDVWDAVEREWSFEKKQQLLEEQYQEIKGQYVITVETAN